MKLGVIVPGFSSDEQDWCIPALLDFVRCLAARDEVHVFSLRYPAPAREYQVLGATVHAIGGGQSTGFARAAILMRGWRAVMNGHRRAPFDVLHAMWADEPGILATRLGRRLAVPTIVSLLGGELSAHSDIRYGIQLSWLGRRAVKTAVQRASWCTAGSSQMLATARALIPGRDWDRATVIPFGTDPDLFSPRGASLPSTDAPVILHVGSLVGVKNQSGLFDAFSQVAARRPDVALHVLGDGPSRGALEDLARRLNLEARIVFHGARPHDELPAWYRGAALCVISSRHESQSLVALEAAACGCAVVGPAVGLLPELSPASLTVPRGDTGALAAAMTKVLSDADLRASMGAEGQRLVHARYTVEHSVTAFRTIYARVIHGPVSST